MDTNPLYSSHYKGSKDYNQWSVKTANATGKQMYQECTVVAKRNHVLMINNTLIIKALLLPRVVLNERTEITIAAVSESKGPA